MILGNNIYNMSLKILTLVALVSFTMAQCPINSKIDNVDSGIISFLASSLPQQTIPYTFGITFPIIPKVAIAIQHFDVQTGNHGNFSVTSSQTSLSSTKFRFQRTTSQWNKLRINYFASSRNDLVIGSTSESFSGIYNTTATSTVQFASQVPNYSRSIIRVFLNGYDYRGTVVDIQVTGRKLQAKQLSVAVDVENDFYLFKIYYSFVVFAPSSIPFASYGGLIAQNNFEGFHYEDAHKIVYNSNYQFYGLNKVTLSGFTPIEFASQIDQNFVAGIYSSRKFDELNLIYIVFGIAPINSCGKCGNGEIFAYGSVCLAKCPPGTYEFKYSDKGSACRVCSERLNQDFFVDKCVCNSQSAEIDGACVLKQGKPFDFLRTLRYDSAGVLTTITTVTTTVTTGPLLTASTIPTQPILITPQVVVSPQLIQPTVISASSQNGTCTGINQYWTGYRCTCMVGFKNDSGSCVPLTLIKTKGWVIRQPAIDPSQNYNQTQPNTTVIVVDHNCYMQFQYFNGDGCVCVQGYGRVNGVCTATTINENVTKCKQQGREWVNNVCQCKNGSLLINNECIPVAASTCPANSYDNGLGTCICDQGFYKDAVTQKCIQGQPCPPSSSRNSSGQCVCNAGLTMYDGYCAKCPLGAIWDTKASKCVFVCGQRAVYSEALKACQCQSGYGIYNGGCTTCPTNFILKNNYCVQCPTNFVYNKVSGKCECAAGYVLNRQGFCDPKCGNGEMYNQTSGGCQCVSGLGRVVLSGQCQVCPAGTLPNAVTQLCENCKVNEQNVDGQCLCKSSFAPNQLGVCVACSDLENGFLINGFCAFCPANQVYNPKTSKCQCPTGKFKSGVRCYDACRNDQLIDLSNTCYSCPINEVIIDGKCQCRKSYTRNVQTNICQLQCKAGEFNYKGRCAACPQNLQYRPEIQGCACPDGMYLNNNGVCEKVVIQAVTCDAGYFFDPNNGCLKCQASCATCSSANTCTSCAQSGFRVTNGQCQAYCGDGLVVSGEACDDGNLLGGDGCSVNCVIEPFWACQGQPSVCRYNGPPVCGNGRIQGTEACDDGNTLPGDGCSAICQKETSVQIQGNITLVGEVNTNINNVFIALKVNKKYSFTNENQMQSFMKTSFPDSTSIPTVYCSQRDQPDEDLWDCLAIYSSGIPNKKFNVVFSFDYQGDKGKINILVDPLKSALPTRSRK